MSDRLFDVAKEALESSRSLGFDDLTVTVARREMLGIRLAQGAVCRENVATEVVTFDVKGIWQGRRSGFESGVVDLRELKEAIARLRHDLERQAADKEIVLPRTPAGRFTWEPTRATLTELYGSETLYPLLEKHAQRVRSKGLRLTGYVEASELNEETVTLQGTEAATRDVGITLSFTVDDGHAQQVGSTQRGATHADPRELDRLIGEAVDEALEISATSGSPAELEPGDYTVVFHPAAALDLVSTIIGYGFLDQRRIDEGRTYLSRNMDAVTFPPGLRLAQTLSLPLPSGRVYGDAPFNHRLVPCAGLELIGGGRIRDLYRSAFWAEKVGMPETFAAHAAPPLLLEATPGSALHGKHATLKDLIKDTPRGLYVANTWYLRMVAEMEGVLTGMTRDGLYEIRDGKLVRPVKHMRWHDNPFRVLGAVTGVTDEKLLLGRSRLAGRSRAPMGLIPGLRVEGFHFSSVTRF